MSEIPIPGTTSLELVEGKGYVRINFHHPVTYAVLDPNTALAFADRLKEYAHNCQGGKLVIAQTPEDIMNAKIMVKLPALRKRVAFRLRKMAEAGKSNADVAADVIDLILSEVS